MINSLRDTERPKYPGFNECFGLGLRWYCQNEQDGVRWFKY